MNAAVLKDRFTVYSQLMRMDKPIGTFLLLWPTYWGLWLASDGHPSPLFVFIFTLGTFLMRSAGCVINDYADRDFDGMVARTKNRPFARGAVSKKEALLLAGSLALLSFLLILPLNTLTWAMSVPALFLAVTYPFTKRFFPLPQAYLGIAFAFGIPMSYAAETNHVPALAWVMLIASGFWTFAYDTCYAMMDRPDDLKLGVIKTSAITIGRYDVLVVMLCQAVFLSIMTGVGLYTGRGWPYYLGIAAAVAQVVWHYPAIASRDGPRCFKVFLDNNWVGCAIFVGLVADYLLR